MRIASSGRVMVGWTVTILTAISGQGLAGTPTTRPATWPTAGSSPKTLTELDSITEAALQERFPFLPRERWKGQKVVLPIYPGKLQDQPCYALADDKGQHAKVRDVQGRTFTVGDWDQDATTWGLSGEDGRQYFSAPDKLEESLDMFVLRRDLDGCTELWQGATLWTRRHTYLDANKLRRLPIGTPVKVLRVTPDGTLSKPIRFYLRTPDGAEVYVDVTMNAPGGRGTLARSLFTTDPRSVVKWDDATWRAVDEWRAA